MDIVQTIVLALIQGVTEFLPISSSAHLILPSQLLGWEDQGLAFDVAVHFGTLLAVMMYFRHDIARLTRGWLTTGFSAQPNDDGRLAWFIAIATVPALVAGALGHSWIAEHARSTMLLALTTIGFALLLGLADRRREQTRTIAQMTLWMALVIGLAQAIALIPGTSRSGITLTAALFLGMARVDAARFSFLLSIPVTMAASLWLGRQLLLSTEQYDLMPLAIGALVAGISAWLCIHFFMVFIQRIGMMPFVYYRLILGSILLLFFVE